MTHITTDLQDHFKTALDAVLMTDFDDLSLRSLIVERVSRLAHFNAEEDTFSRF
jgi:hypothetical protein